MAKPRVLCLDIEWRPTKAYVWGAWQENILPEKIIEHGGLLCVGAQWVGEKEVEVFTEWELGHREMLERIRQMMSDADAVIGYNSDKFDLRKLEGEFVLNKMKFPPPIPSIDLIKSIRKMGFFMARLGFIGPFLGIGAKLENGGMSLWTKVIDGDKKAQDKMKKYCAQDVRLTTKLYERIKPYIKNHPRLTDDVETCPSCGGNHTQHRGFNRSRYFKTQRIQCISCGHWFQGKRQKI